MSKFIKMAMSVAVMAALGTGVAHADIVTNGDFENAFAGWTSNMVLLATWGVGGSTAAVTGCVGHNCVDTLGGGAFIQQNLATTALQSC